MTDYDNIISFEKLYKAHRKARLGKRHKKEIIEFEMNLSENLWKLHNELRYGEYKVSGYHKFMIYDPKEREIQAITYKDRIVQHTLCDNYLTPLLEKHLIYDNAACRKGKGTAFLISRFREFLAKYYKSYGDKGYFVKLDIQKYFNNIEHDLLKEKLKGIVTDERALALLFLIIDSYHYSDNRGLPMGNQTSQCFALLFLNVIDRCIKETMRVKYYVRYMDDMVLLAADKSTAAEYFSKIKDDIIKEKLIPNVKSRIIAVKSGIELLGWRFSFGNNGRIVQKVRKSTRYRILIKAGNLADSSHNKNEYKKEVMVTLISYRGYLSQGNSYYLYNKISSVLLPQ